MELNTSALAKNINNITSMSELFVANVRTPFTDFVHPSSSIIHFNPQAHLNSGTSATNSTQSSSTSSPANNHHIASQSSLPFSHHYQLHHQFNPSSTSHQDNSSASTMFSANHKNLAGQLPVTVSGVLDIPQHHSSINPGNLLLNNTGHSQMHSSQPATNSTTNNTSTNNNNNNNNENNFSNNHQLHSNYLTGNHISNNNNNNNSNNNSNNNNNNSNNESNANNNTNANHNDSIGNTNINATNTNTNTNMNNNNNKNDNSNGNSNNPSNHQHNRLSQPLRTQIPIHCYIEQLDACADMPGYSSSLNDNDLFNTVNNNQLYKTTSPNSSSLNVQIQSHISNQPHLHQSKLALESVTNCTNSSNNNNSNLYNRQQQNLASTSNINDAQQQHSSMGQLHLDNNKLASTSDNNHQGFPRCRDKIAIVTSNVLFIDLVRAVLPQLGYSAADLINAKATIQIKNWKPLALDQVTEDKRATVGDILADISTFVTLRIRLYSSVSQLPTEWTETMIRQVVLALTQTMSQLTLSKLCNISQPLISSIVRGNKKLGRRKCAEFGQWYMNYIKSAEAQPSSMFCEGGGARLVFDKTREIPQLKAWFANNTKPSDETLEEYSRILNDHETRKDSTTIKPQITAKALRNWWKNERQKLGIRQREIRGRPKLKRIDC